VPGGQRERHVVHGDERSKRLPEVFDVQHAIARLKPSRYAKRKMSDRLTPSQRFNDVDGILSCGMRAPRVLSANGRFYPTNGVSAALEVLLRPRVSGLADPALHGPVQLRRTVDTEVVPVAGWAEGLDLLDARVGREPALQDQADSE